MRIATKIAIPACALLMATASVTVASAASASAQQVPSYTCDQVIALAPGFSVGDGNCTTADSLPSEGPVEGKFGLNDKSNGANSVVCQFGFAFLPDAIEGSACTPAKG